MDQIMYYRILAVVIIILAGWVGLILYRVIRESAIRHVDFWRAKWKIVLFWFVAAVIIAGGWYLLNKYGILGWFKK